MRAKNIATVVGALLTVVTVSAQSTTGTTSSVKPLSTEQNTANKITVLSPGIYKSKHDSIIVVAVEYNRLDKNTGLKTDGNGIARDTLKAYVKTLSQTVQEYGMDNIGAIYTKAYGDKNISIYTYNELGNDKGEDITKQVIATLKECPINLNQYKIQKK